MSLKDKNIAHALRGAPNLVLSTVALMEELANVLTDEITIVTHKKMAEHPELLKHKQRLAVDYRANMRTIAAHPDLFKKLPDEAKAAVKEMAGRLTDALDANAYMLRAAVDATRQLIQNIMAMVKKETMPRQTYKNHAKAHLQLGNHNSLCRPVAISRTV